MKYILSAIVAVFTCAACHTTCDSSHGSCPVAKGKKADTCCATKPDTCCKKKK
jgi:hypothetical protein